MNYFFTILLFIGMLGSHGAMAGVLASASSSPSTTTINHPVAVTLAVINGGASALTVTDIKITATSTSNPSSSRLPAAFSVFNKNGPAISLAANATTSVPGGTVIFFSPSTGITGSGSGTYSIGGTIFTSDGSATAISQSAVTTINPIPLPAYERQ